MKHRAAFALIALVGAVLDLWTKHLAFLHLRTGEELVVIEGFFEFGKTWNKGIVFGLAPGASTVFLWVSILAVPAIIAIFLSLRKPRWVMTVSLALILGGTLGNMVDRITEPGVRDFIKFYWAPGRPWPLFNLADSCICVGVALLSLEMMFFDEKKKKGKEPEPAPAAAPASAVPSGPTVNVHVDVRVGTEAASASAVPSGPTEPIPRQEDPAKTDAPKPESPAAPAGGASGGP